MCGRVNVSDHAGVEWLLEEFGIPLHEFIPRYNISPGSELYTLSSTQCEIALSPMNWGLRPQWAKADSRPLINARSETIWEKPSFRSLIGSRRVVIPINGFYEWQRVADKTSQAYYISPRNGPAIGLAGVFDYSSQGAPQCCIITTAAADASMKAVHHRQPVMLRREELPLWLNENNRSILDGLMAPRETESWLTIRPVSNYVNHAGNEGPRCIAGGMYARPDDLFATE